MTKSTITPIVRSVRFKAPAVAKGISGTPGASESRGGALEGPERPSYGRSPSPIRHTKHKPVCDACENKHIRYAVGCATQAVWSVYNACVVSGAIACTCKCHGMAEHYKTLQLPKINTASA